MTLCLAGETISESYDTEYSTDKIEMHTGAVNAGQRVVLVRLVVCIIDNASTVFSTSLDYPAICMLRAAQSAQL
jgi:hypothetical protein